MKTHWTANTSPDDSPAYSVLVRLWNGTNEVKSHSWQTLNQSMRSGVYLAIEAGMRFNEDDFAKMDAKMAMHRWGIEHQGGYGQGFYAHAVKSGNRSAAMAFEKYREFKPFILSGQRLYCGAELWQASAAFDCAQWWDAPTDKIAIDRFWVTSIDTDKECFTACWYDNPGNHQDGKPKRRITMTQSDFKVLLKAKSLFLSREAASDLWRAQQPVNETPPDGKD